MAWSRNPPGKPGKPLRRSEKTNILALVKSDHRYLIFYDDGSEADALCQLGRWMEDDRLNFGEADARVMAATIHVNRPPESDEEGRNRES